MNKKKQTPLVVLKALEPFIDKIGENFISVKSENNLIRLTDIDPDSEFYFNFENYDIKDGFKVLIEYRPHSELNVEKHRTWITGSQIKTYFTQWVTLLKSYDEVRSPYDDPIIESFKDDYYTEFEIIDEEKNKPLTPKHILLLDAYFEKIENKIDEHITNSNAEQIKEIKKDISELRENLSRKTKVWIANKISWIWAKMTKLGPKLMKDFIDEGNKQIVKESVVQIIEYGKTLFS